jgi:hypothetical protein
MRNVANELAAVGPGTRHSGPINPSRRPCAVQLTGHLLEDSRNRAADG